MSRILFVVLAIMAASVYGVHLIDQSGVTSGKRMVAKQVKRRQPDPGSVVITARNGHYATEALVDGHEVDFIVDTGATVVTLRESDAADLGYRPYEQDYKVKITTANGEGRGAFVRLSRVEVGDITVHDVSALVLHDDAL